jgi:hypothetical protein
MGPKHCMATSVSFRYCSLYSRSTSLSTYWTGSGSALEPIWTLAEEKVLCRYWNSNPSPVQSIIQTVQTYLLSYPGTSDKYVDLL